MTRPATYNVGATIEIDLTALDANDNPVTPDESRVSILQPDGTVFTVSGIYPSYDYDATQLGFHVYEGWVIKNAVEDAQTHGFHIVNHVGN